MSILVMFSLMLVNFVATSFEDACNVTVNTAYLLAVVMAIDRSKW